MASSQQTGGLYDNSTSSGSFIPEFMGSTLLVLRPSQSSLSKSRCTSALWTPGVSLSMSQRIYSHKKKTEDPTKLRQEIEEKSLTRSRSWRKTQEAAVAAAATNTVNEFDEIQPSIHLQVFDVKRSKDKSSNQNSGSASYSYNNSTAHLSHHTPRRGDQTHQTPRRDGTSPRKDTMMSSPRRHSTTGTSPVHNRSTNTHSHNNPNHHHNVSHTGMPSKSYQRNTQLQPLYGNSLENDSAAPAPGPGERPKYVPLPSWRKKANKRDKIKLLGNTYHNK